METFVAKKRGKALTPGRRAGGGGPVLNAANKLGKGDLVSFRWSVLSSSVSVALKCEAPDIMQRLFFENKLSHTSDLLLLAATRTPASACRPPRGLAAVSGSTCSSLLAWLARPTEGPVALWEASCHLRGKNSYLHSVKTC